MKCTGPNHRDWYDAIATRNGGYRKTWSSTIEGESGEDVFRDTLLNLLEPHMEVLDAGCGSAEFSIEVARQVRHLTGFDFSENMVRRAKANATSAGAINCNYIVASTHNMPFSDASFDLIYSRRGPTSILLNPQILRKGGWMLGVHSSGAEVIQERIEASGLEDIEFTEFAAQEIIFTWEDFTEYWSRMPGHPDYSDPNYGEEIEALAVEHRRGDRFIVPHRRFVWRARKPT